MASYAVWREDEQRYVLGPPLIPAQEIHPARTTSNPGFELAYWRFGLETAQRWRERLGLPRDPAWDRVVAQLSPLPSRDGLYVNAESAPETWTRCRPTAGITRRCSRRAACCRAKAWIAR